MVEANLFIGDCFEVMKQIPDGSIDAVITDLPYGITACRWDRVLPFEPMWKEIDRLLKPRGSFITTSSQPFTSKLVMSNLAWFKYEWIWHKHKSTGFLHAKNAPLKNHENIVVFSKGAISHASRSTNRMIYNPQFTAGEPYKRIHRKTDKRVWEGIGRLPKEPFESVNNGFRYPVSVIEGENHIANYEHPTQKPVSLFEYLIRTYTNEGDWVLDFCAGSGTTGVAAIQTGRSVILIEKEPEYFRVAQRRVQTALQIHNQYMALGRVNRCILRSSLSTGTA